MRKITLELLICGVIIAGRVWSSGRIEQLLPAQCVDVSNTPFRLSDFGTIAALFGPYCYQGYYFDDVDRVCVPVGPVTEIDGHSVAEILQTLEEHRAELHAIRGVTGTGVDRHGIKVEADVDHGDIPEFVGGLRVHVKPAKVRVGN